MDEAAWDTCTQPDKMLAFLRDSGLASERRCRLFACACVRRVWHLLKDERSRKAVEVAEQYADGDFGAEQQQVAVLAALVAARSRGRPDDEVGFAAAYTLDDINRTAFLDQVYKATGNASVDRAAKAALLRDIFGPLPFRPLPSLPATWLTWNGGIVKRLAEEAYEGRGLPAGTFDQVGLAVLADALEELGADAELVAHLRGPGPHVRGCWCIDLLLNKGQPMTQANWLAAQDPTPILTSLRE